MVGVAFRFELGRYHATPWGTNVNDAATEWPPSPWRLLRALYATARAHTGLQARYEAIDRAIVALMASGPPVFELPRALPAHTRHYMPKASYSPVATGETAKVLDGFMAVDPEAELRAWWDATLDRDALDALTTVADSLSYVGRSESLCTARVLADATPETVDAAPATDTPVGNDAFELVDLLSPDADAALDALTVSVTELRGERRRFPPATRHVTYAVRSVDRSPAGTSTPRRRDQPQLAMLRLHGPHRPAVTEAVALGQSLRRALQSCYGRANDRGVSATFSGRDGGMPRADQHRHAHYISAPEPRSPRVDRLFVWAPERFGPDEVAALAAVPHLRLNGIPEPIPCVLAALGTPSTMDLPPVAVRSATWRSITPFGLPRHPKVRGGRVIDSPEEQVRRELRHRGMPEPLDVNLEKGSWHRFRSSKVGTSRLQRASLYGIRLRFAEPVQGPIAIGALSHYGLGLMGPDW